jgi:hypothetical protein
VKHNTGSNQRNIGLRLAIAQQPKVQNLRRNSKNYLLTLGAFNDYLVSFVVKVQEILEIGREQKVVAALAL